MDDQKNNPFQITDIKILLFILIEQLLHSNTIKKKGATRKLYYIFVLSKGEHTLNKCQALPCKKCINLNKHSKIYNIIFNSNHILTNLLSSCIKEGRFGVNVSK